MDNKNNSIGFLERKIEGLVKSKKKTVAVLIVMIFCLTGVSTFFGFLYIDVYSRHKQLTSDYNKLEGEYTELTIDYAELMEEYIELNDDYNELEDDYNNLTLEYNDLVDDYNSLSSSYSSLCGSYQSVLNVLEKPLTSYVIPTISEVHFWLSSDNTDEYDYVNNTWMCGDFSAMLMVRAKAKNWRMRIAVISFSREGDAMYNMNYPYGEYGHAFNLIYCQDGSDSDSELDLYYIEPQTDRVWWINYGDDNHELHYIMWGGYYYGYWGDPYWVNYYNYFA